MPVTPINDTHLYIDDSGGTGRPVVLIHGWPLSGESWDAQVPDLIAAGYRVITYDRRGFGRSSTGTSYDYDTLAADLAGIMAHLDLQDATLVGFSMGGGEVARYLARHGGQRVRSVVFASSVTPYMMQTNDNPEGPLTTLAAEKMEGQLRADRAAFYDTFTTDFFSVKALLGLVSDLKVTEDTRQMAMNICLQSDQTAALACMRSFGTTDFRDDLAAVTCPTLVIHGDGDGIVPFEGSGERTHEAVPGSELVLIAGGPHGVNASHPSQFNVALLDFLSA